MIIKLLERIFKTCFHKVDADDMWWPEGSHSMHGICKKCGKELLQDSQGGWF